MAWPLALGLYATELWQLAEKAAPPWTAGSLLYLVAAGAAACIAALTWRGYQLRSFAHRVAALLYLALTGVLLIVVLCLAPGTYGLPVLQPRGAAYLVLIAAITATLMAYRRRGRPEDRERRDWSWGLTVILHAAALVFFTLEAHDFWIVRAPGWFENPQHGWYARHMTLSLGYALYGFALLWTGILRRQTLLRVLALIILAGTICKVGFYDMREIEAIWRVLSFLGLGLLLMLGSLLYHKYGRLIFPAIAEKSAEPGPAPSRRRPRLRFPEGARGGYCPLAHARNCRSRSSTETGRPSGRPFSRSHEAMSPPFASFWAMPRKTFSLPLFWIRKSAKTRHWA